MSTSPAPTTTKHSTRPYLIGCFVAFLLICVCLVLLGGLGGLVYVAQQNGLPGFLAPASPVPTPSKAPTSAITPPPSSPTQWPIVFMDDFADNANGWNISARQPDSNEFGTFGQIIANDRFRIEADTSGASKSNPQVYWPTMKPVSDFELTVDAQRISGDQGAGFVVMFRRDNNGNYYEFFIQDDQRFGVELFYQGQWKTMIDRTHSNAIQNGGVNHIKVRAQGAHFTFFVNDQPIADLTDTTLSSGRAGLGIDMDVAVNAVVEFAAFELHAP